MKKVGAGLAVGILWLSLLLRAAFPALRAGVIGTLRQSFDPERICTQAVSTMGEELAQVGLHKTIECLFDAFDEKLLIPAFDRE